MNDFIIGLNCNRLTSKNGFLLRMLLSWLFDQSNFPRSLFSKTDVELSAHIHSATWDDLSLNESQLLSKSAE